MFPRCYVWTPVQLGILTNKERFLKFARLFHNFILNREFGSNLFYNMSATQMTHAQREWDTSDISETQETQERHKWCNATQTTRARHDCNLTYKIATRVENFDFHNDTSENMFLFFKRFIICFLKDSNYSNWF